jgi:hypothetical protein
MLRDEILTSPDLALVWWLRNRCATSSSLTEKEFQDAMGSIESKLKEATRPTNATEIFEEVLNSIDQDKQLNFFRHMRGVLEMIDQSPAAERLAIALTQYDDRATPYGSTNGADPET